MKKTTYCVRYTIKENDNWIKKPCNIRVFWIDEDRNETAPTESGLTMEDVGQEEWNKIQRAVDSIIYPSGGVDWSSWGDGEEDYNYFSI